MDAPPPGLQQRVRRLLGKTPRSYTRTTGGYTMAERWVARFDDGKSCFIKSGTTGLLPGFIRDEYRLVYARLQSPFIPRLLAWEDDGEAPLLILEDLSAAVWPPPWDDARVEAVRSTLEKVWALDAPDLPSLASQHELLNGWRRVAGDPSPFLRLGIARTAWLDRCLAHLIEASEGAVLEGADTLHLDVRSDNLCFVDGRAVLVDWNHVCRGNGTFDLAAWLPSLHSEGGPLPEALLPDAPAMASVISGYFAARAGLPTNPAAPRVRAVQLSQLRSALPWAVRALDLPPLDGPQAP